MQGLIKKQIMLEIDYKPMVVQRQSVDNPAHFAVKKCWPSGGPTAEIMSLCQRWANVGPAAKMS